MEAGPGEGRDWRGDVMFFSITQFRAVGPYVWLWLWYQTARQDEEEEKGSGVDD
jgi:hypothetical protein